jgi:hypothetical protein
MNAAKRIGEMLLAVGATVCLVAMTPSGSGAALRAARISEARRGRFRTMWEAKTGSPDQCRGREAGRRATGKGMSARLFIGIALWGLLWVPGGANASQAGPEGMSRFGPSLRSPDTTAER